MATALGHLGGHFCFGLEASWGGVDTRDQKLKLRTGGDGVVVTQEEILSEEIPSINLDGAESVIGNKAVAGPLTFACQYEGHEMIYHHALGGVSSSQPDVTGASTTWENIFTIADALPEGLSLEIDRDTYELLAVGGMITSIEWSIDVNGILTCTINIVAKDATWTQTPTGGLVAPTAAYIKYSDQGAGVYIVTYNETEIKATNLTWSLDNGLDIDRRFLGSNLISRPTRSSKLMVTGSFTAEFEDTVEYDDFIAHTERALVLQFIGPTIEAAYTYEERHSFDKVRIRGGTPTVNDEGRVTYDLNFRAYYEDANNKELEILCRNTIDATTLCA